MSSFSPSLAEWLPAPEPADPTAEPRLHVVCRTSAQLGAVLTSPVAVASVTLDYEDLRRYADAVETARRTPEAPPLFLATPRIQKSGEEGFFKLIARAAPDGVLIRNLGGIQWFRREAPELTGVGDFSLNVSNPITARLFREQGLERLTLSYDLNAGQALDLLQSAPPQWFELTLHQHMPLFHMEHCVFCTFLSEGTDYTNCGRPCESQEVRLRDRVGQEHLLSADTGCRNTLFNGRAQTAARYFQPFLDSGLRDYRLELLREDASATWQLLRIYDDLLAGRIEGDEAWSEVGAISRLGVTEGTLG